MPPVMEHLIRYDSVECSKVKAVGSKYPKHTHEEYVISANLSGHERIWFNGRCQDVFPNQVTLYNPLTVQASEFSPKGAQFLSVHLDAQKIHSLLNDGSQTQTPPNFREGVVCDGALFKSIQDLYESSNSTRQEEALLVLLGELARFKDTPVNVIEPVRVSRLIQYMSDHLYEKISLEDLCLEANLSKFHLVRSFKAYTSLPPMQYFNQLRLIEARKRLRAGEQPVRIATDLGFFDQGHLTNAFRKVMGVSPYTYSSMLRHD